MATTHEVITRDIERNAAVQAETRKLARYLVQRGAIDNTAYLSSAAVSVATTSLTAVPGLTIACGVGYNSGSAVVGGRTYKFRAVLPSTVDGTSGIKMDWSGGTCTFASFAAVGYNYTASAIATLAVTSATGLTVNAAAAYTSMIVEGTFVASGSGSFGPRMALTTGTTTASLLAGGQLSLTEIAQ